MTQNSFGWAISSIVSLRTFAMYPSCCACDRFTEVAWQAVQAAAAGPITISSAWDDQLVPASTVRGTAFVWSGISKASALWQARHSFGRFG